MKRFVTILTIAAICLTGCLESRHVETGHGLSEAGQTGTDSNLQSIEVWTNQYGPGLKLTTQHYEVYTTLLNSRLLERIGRFMESAYQNYNGQLPEPIETVTRFQIYLFAGRSQWEDFTRAFTGEQAQTYCAIKAGAYCHNGTCVAYDIGEKRTFEALGHEGWHQFNSRHFKFRLPSWLDEGVAMLFEKYGANGQGFYFNPGDNEYRLRALSKTLTKDKMIPLKELVVMNPGDVLATDETEAVMAFYSQSYALVRFLMESNHGQRLSVYRRLLADGLKGNWPLDEVSGKIASDRNYPRTILWNHIVGLVLFEEYIGYDFEQIEKEYLAFCRQITNP